MNNSYRLFNGRLVSDPTLHSITIDKYGQLLLITTYGDTPFPRKLTQKYYNNETHIIWRKRSSRKTNWKIIQGGDQEEFICQEHGLKYHLKLGKNQNIGLFLDMSPLRHYLLHNAQNKRILNLFAYTCTLSVAALRGGAQEVINVDMKSTFLNWGKDNHRLNKLPLTQVKFLKHNILKSLNGYIKRGPFDLVIVDPPTYQPGGFKLLQDYTKILKRIPVLLTKQGMAFISCNDPLLSQDDFFHLVTQELPPQKLKYQLPLAPNFDGPKILTYTN